MAQEEMIETIVKTYVLANQGGRVGHTIYRSRTSIAIPYIVWFPVHTIDKYYYRNRLMFTCYSHMIYRVDNLIVAAFNRDKV